MSLFPKPPKIIVVGDVILDIHRLGNATRISPEAPVPVVLNPEASFSLGGAAAVAAQCAAIGADVKLFSVVGADAQGHQIRELCQAASIDGGMITDRERVTTTKERICAVASGQQRQQIARMDRETVAPITDEQAANIIAEIMKHPAADAIIIADYGKGVCTESLANGCIASGVPVLVDPPSHGDWEKYRWATCLVPNRSEAAGRSCLAICEQFSLEACVVKLDRDGCEVCSGTTHIGLCAPKCPAVRDVTGAGDTFIALVACGISAELSWEEAASLANRAAGIQVGQFGTSPVPADELKSCLLAIMEQRQTP